MVEKNRRKFVIFAETEKNRLKIERVDDFGVLSSPGLNVLAKLPGETVFVLIPVIDGLPILSVQALGSAEPHSHFD